MAISMEIQKSKPKSLKKLQKLTAKTVFQGPKSGIGLRFGNSDLFRSLKLGFRVPGSVIINNTASKDQKKVIGMEFEKNEIIEKSVQRPDSRRPVPPWSVPMVRGWA